MEDYYCVEEFSDNELIDSSSDDEDFKSLFTFVGSDDEDFETEMERERENHINGIHKSVPKTKELKSKDETNDEKSDSEDKNDELLYDPKSDENDQKWVDNRRPKRSSGRESDATLNCPNCMSLLCMDCQRHEIYRTQYRAMFVFNCRIDFSEKLEYKQKKRKRNQKSGDNTIDTYFAVFCEQCNTRVAVYDQNEVYHFFSVLSSF